MSEPARYDLFLSHGAPDMLWVKSLARELEALGIAAFLDADEIRPGDNFVLRLSEGLETSRFLVLIVSAETFGRPWVDQEWSSFLADHGPAGRVLPVLLEPAEVPAILKATQYLDAGHRDAARVARELASIAGRTGAQPDDARRTPAQALSFVLGRSEEALEVTGPDGRKRKVTPPWASGGARFAVARLGFQGLSRKAVESCEEHAELVRCATAYGELLFAILFDDAGAERPTEGGQERLLRRTIATPGYGRPLLTIASDDDVLLSLPWELLHDGGCFLVGEGRADLVRTIRVRPVPEPWCRNLAAGLERRVAGGLPPFFYLASCHGNEPAVPEEGRSGAESSAAHLHRAGVAQVIGYYSPIHAEFSTRAEVAIYGALAAGETARHALRWAREALRRPFRATGEDHRPGRAVAAEAAPEVAAAPASTHPFAWAQLVFYHRGPDRPLCKAEPSALRSARETVLDRTFQGLGRCKVLQTGFVRPAGRPPQGAPAHRS